MQSPVSTILEYLQEIRRLIKLALPELYRRKIRVTDTKNNYTHVIDPKNNYTHVIDPKNNHTHF